MKNFTQKFIGLFVLLFSMSFTTNAQTIQVYYQSDVPIAGFQFNIDVWGGTLNSAYGGAAEEAGFMISSGGNTVLGFSLEGATIPAGEGVLVEVEIVGDYDPCIYDIVLSDTYGNSLDYSLENCFTIIVGFSEIYGCTGPSHCNYNPDATVDDGSCVYAMEGYDCDGNCLLEIDCMGECGGSAIIDECGVCGGDGSSCPQYEIVQVYYQSDVPIAGFQFNVDGYMNSAYGGAAQEAGFMISSSSSILLGFSMEGATISAGEGILVELELFDDFLCIYNLVISDIYGNALPVYVENCNTIVVGSLGCTDENGVFYDEGVQWSTDPCTLCSCEDGEIFCSTVDCEIPECEAPNYLDDVSGECCPVCVEVEPVSDCEQQDIPLNLPQGWSMFGYTCLESVDVIEAFTDINQNITIVKDYLGNAYLPSWSFDAIGELEFARGYQIKMIETVEDFQFCTTPSVMQGASQEEIDAAYLEGAASVNPEDGIGQEDVDAAYADGYSDGIESTSTETVSIGDVHEGGIVFQINEDGTGLVVIAEDFEELYPWPQAVSEAGAFTSGGYSDWYLPNSEELESMFSTIGPGTEENIGGFNESISYWSSTKYFGSYAWAVFFSNGNAYFQPESDTYKVRVIRSF